MSRIGPLKQTWYKWKALRLPWRKQFLVGVDLQGNTYWEFRLSRRQGSNERMRRIVHYPHSTHLSSVKVGPLWHQWLRYTRADPPTLEEQQGDVVRQERIKILAAEADARWEAKPRAMDAPGGETGQRLPPLKTGELDQEGGKMADAVTAKQPTSTETTKTSSRGGAAKKTDKNDNVEDPWAQARPRGGPSEEWQPAAWTPTATKKR